MITFGFNDSSVYELGSASVHMDIGGFFQDGTGITDALLNTIGRALEAPLATATGHAPELIDIRVDQGPREVTIT